MRIDKYLWCVRYFKTRGLAADAIKKAMYLLMVKLQKDLGKFIQRIQLYFRKDQIKYQITILDIPANRVGAKLVDMYRKDETPEEAFAHLELLKLTKRTLQSQRNWTTNKKDRRN